MFSSSIKASWTITLPRGNIFWHLAQHCQGTPLAQFHRCSLLDNPYLSLYYLHESVHYFLHVYLKSIYLNLLALEPASHF